MNTLARIRNTLWDERRRLTDRITGTTPPPCWLSIELTYDCPSRCKTCNIWTSGFRDARVAGRKKLSVADWKSIIDQIAAAGVRSVLLVGGEPFTYPGIFEVLNELREKHVAADCFTNGLFLTDEKAERIVRSGMRSLTFSLDGPTAAVHDAVRDAPGSFEKSIAAIRSIRKLKQDIGVSSPIIAVNTTVSSMNIRDLAGMPPLAMSLGAASISFHLFSTVQESVMAATNAMLGKNAVTVHSFSHLSERMMLSESELGMFLEISNRYRYESCGIACMFDPMIHNVPAAQLARGLFLVKRCNFFWNSSIISPYGEVFACPMIPDYDMGDCSTRSFNEIWNNERYRSLRSLFRKKMLPICAQCCVRS